MPTQESFQFSNLLADRTQTRTAGGFWSNVPKVENPHPKPIQLIGGLPNYQFFPVKTIDVHLRDEPFNEAEGNDFTCIGHAPNEELADIRTSLQYSNEIGLDALRGQIRQFVLRVVRPELPTWDVVCTLGGSDGIAKCFDILVNPGDTVLFEEFTFTPVLNTLTERGGIAVPIRMDKIMKEENFDYSDELENLLNNWSTLKPNMRKPKALYTIPNGHNPLGLAQSLEHKKKIYELAELHNFIIIEDEPYSYLNFTKFDDKETNYNLTNDEFINSLNPSYMTLDTCGRVIRVETFSKIYAPGLRLGFLVCNEGFIKAFTDAAGVLTRAPNGFSQMFLNNTIIRLGGTEGWINWITKVRNEYLKRKNLYVSSLFASKSSAKGYLRAIDPDCGMFVSIIINIEKHKSFNGDNYNELMDLFYIKCVESGILVVLGRNMSVNQQFSLPRSNFIRTAVSFVDTHQLLKECTERLDEATINFFEDSD